MTPHPLRLAFGTLTVLPVRAPVVDRTVAGRAMLLAPLVGLALAVPAVAVVWLVAAPLLAAVLVVGLTALLTRGLHLDGLADTADGLGCGLPPAGALEVMRRSDIGPFGVVTLVLVLLAQVSALATLLTTGHGASALLAALVVSRLSLPLACLVGVPSARPDGLGATVAQTVSRSMAGLATLLVLTLIVPAGLWDGGSDAAVRLLLGALLGLGAGAVVVRRAVLRFGGITGDVLGAAVETTFTATLVLLALV